VKVQPKSRRPGIQDCTNAVHGPCLCVGVKGAAHDGWTHRAACTVLADALHVPASAVAVMFGYTSRDKTLHVDGDYALLTVR
jgi:uncharacterized protein